MIRNLIIGLILLFNVNNSFSQINYDKLFEYRQLEKEHYHMHYFLGNWKQLAEAYDEYDSKKHFNGILKADNLYNDRYIMMNSELDFQNTTFYKKYFLGFNKIVNKYQLITFDNVELIPQILFGTFDESTKIYTFLGEIYNPEIAKQVQIKIVFEITSDVNFTMYNYIEDKMGNEKLTIKIVHVKTP